MSMIKQYTKKSGKKAYLFYAYLGINPLTNKPVNVVRKGFNTKKEASLALAKLELDTDEKGFSNNKYETFQDIYDLFIVQYKTTVKESSYTKVLATFNKHILPKFGKMKLKKITVGYCQRCVNDWYEVYSKGGYITQLVSRVLDMAVNMDCINSNPMKKIIRPRVNKEHKDDSLKFYTKEELQDFFSHLKEDGNLKHYTYFRVLAFSGCRKSEVSALTWNDINFENKSIDINKTLAEGLGYTVKVQSTKTTKSARVLTMDETTMAVLKQWRSRQATDLLKLGYNSMSKDQLVFPASTHNSYIRITIPNEWLEAFYKRHPMKKLTVHSFRHTHASLLFEAGATIKEVQDRLGHTNINTTMNIYTHVSQKKKDETAEKFASFVNF